VSRNPVHLYRDPLDALWIEALRQIGLSLDRTDHAYATTDGRGRLALSSAPGLDPDDCVAQMVLHELCHSLVQGPDSFQLSDWGLDNETERDVVLEHACLRVQAALLSPHGLRQALAPTTDYRAYYDALPADPFEVDAPGEVEAILLARAGHARRAKRPWAPHLERALEATRDLIAAAKPYLPSDHVLASASEPPAGHPTGLLPSFAGGAETRHCGECAWARGSGRKKRRCVLSDRKVKVTEAACAHYEKELDCLTCGACCREAYDTVEVAADDRTLRHQELLAPRHGGYDVRREDGRCVALSGGQRLEQRGRPPRSLPLYRPSQERFLCSIYEDRPTSCRDFTRGSEHCLSARRTLGLSV